MPLTKSRSLSKGIVMQSFIEVKHYSKIKFSYKKSNLM